MLKPSTHDLLVLPDIAGLRRLCQSLAMLDAILYPDWQGRYYSFNGCWDDRTSLGSMRNAEGDDYFILFMPAGAVIKGFAHESEMSPYQTQPNSVWPGLLDELPQELKPALSDPALLLEDVTFCIWRLTQDNAWRRGGITFPNSKDADGSADLLALLDGNPQSYQRWAEEYYEREIDLGAVEQVYRHEPLTGSLVELLNPEISLIDIEEDIKETGYPA